MGNDARLESRREWLERIVSAALVFPAVASVPAFANSTFGASKRTRWSMPGLFPGRVVSVHHPGAIVDGRYKREPVSAMMRRAMTELTDAPDWVAAWRSFFEPGEVVGIKLNPSSLPYVISAPEVVQEIIAGLEAAGIRRKDIVVYDRYKDMFLKAELDKWVPDGVRTSWATDYVDRVQQRMDGYDARRSSEIALMPVCTGSFTGCRSTTPGARRSTALNCVV